MYDFTASHVDTCLPDYWRGHHLPHVQIAVFPTMKMQDIKDALISEVNQGAIGGSQDFEVTESEEFCKALTVAINNIIPLDPDGKDSFFEDIETDPEMDDDDCYDSVYAYFVFTDDE